MNTGYVLERKETAPELIRVQGGTRRVAQSAELPLTEPKQHLGPPSRPKLVSLDLGFNELTDLQGMIAGLCTLKHLRLLVLQGNPLALVPYYRGFTVDSLARLCVLDDITVSPSEKHQFRGLSIHGGRCITHPGLCPVSWPAALPLPLALVRSTKYFVGFLCVGPLCLGRGVAAVFLDLVSMVARHHPLVAPDMRCTRAFAGRVVGCWGSQKR